MGARLVLLGGILIVLGVSLISAPIDEGSVTSTIVASGLWTDVAVPASSSWTGSPVDLELSWGALPVPCPGYGVFCPGPPAYPQSNLRVYDCGTAPCGTGRAYPLVVATTPAPGGNTEINGTPGEHYQVWAWTHAGGRPVDGAVQVRYAVDGPLFDGVLGVAMTGFGIEAAVVAALPLRVERWQTKLLASRF